MNALFSLALLLFHSTVLSVAIKCYHCIENTWSECQQKQTKVTCDDPFPPGNSHCYSVSGEYDNGTVIRGVVARGCVDCKDKAKACQLFRLVLATVTREPRSCHMECCDEDYCNTMTPLITKYSGISEASQKTAVAVEYSSAHHNSLQLINFFAIALRLCWTVLANNWRFAKSRAWFKGMRMNENM